MGVHCATCTCPTHMRTFAVVGDWPDERLGRAVIATHRSQARRRLDTALRERGLPDSRQKPYRLELVAVTPVDAEPVPAPRRTRRGARVGN